MKVSILYHPESDHARSVEEFRHNFYQQTNHEIELVSLETPDGANLAKLYDVISYPAVLARSDDGHLLKLWQNQSLPLINEVSFFAQDDN